VTWYEKQGDDESATYKRIGTGVMLKNIQSRIGQDVYYEIVPHDYYNYNTYDAVYNWLRIKGVPLDETKTKVTVTDEAQKINVSLTAVPEPAVFSGKIENYDAVGMENLTFSISQDPFADYLAGNSYYSYGSKWNELNKSITVSGNGTFTARVWDFDLTLKISDKNDNFKTFYKTVKAKDLKNQISVTMAAEDLPTYIPLEITRQYPYAYGDEGFSTDTLSRGSWWSNEGIFNDMDFTLKKGDTVIPKDLYTVTPSSVEFTGDVSGYFGMGDTLTLYYTVKDIMGETQKTSDSVKVLKYYSYSTDSQDRRFNLSYKEYGNIYARSESWSNIAIYSDLGELVDTKGGYSNETSGFKAGEYTVVNFASNDWLSAPSDLALLTEILSEDEYLSKKVTVQNGLCTQVEFGELPKLKEHKTFTENSKFGDETVKTNADEWALIKLSYEVDPTLAAANSGSQYVIKVESGSYSDGTNRPMIRYDGSAVTANTAVKDKYFSLYRDGRLKDCTVQVAFSDNNHLFTKGFYLYTTESAGDIYFYAKQPDAGEYTFSASGARLDDKQREISGSKQSFGNMTLSVAAAGAVLNFSSDYLRTADNGAGSGQYNNVAWVYTSSVYNTALYMDGIKIANGYNTWTSGVSVFTFAITDAKVGSADISEFRAKDPDWTVAGEHELYTICKEAGGNEIRSAVSNMTVVTKQNFTPAVLKTVNVKTISDNPKDPMTNHEECLFDYDSARGKSVYLGQNYWSLSLEKSNVFTYEFTVEAEDGENVSDVYLTLTGQDGEDHIAILTRDGDSNKFVGSISGEKLLFNNWSVGIRSKIPDIVDATLLDADIEALIAKYGENFKIYNAETGSEQTIREYYNYIYNAYMTAYEDQPEQLMQDKMEVLDAYLEGASEFDSFLEGDDFDYSTFDGSEESLKELKEHFGIREGTYADIPEEVWADGDFTETTDQTGRKLRALQTAEIDENNHLILLWYSAVLPTEDDPEGYSYIQGLDCGSLVDESAEDVLQSQGKGREETLSSQTGDGDNWPTVSKAGISKLQNSASIANAIHDKVVGKKTVYADSFAGWRANLNVGALQTDHRKQTKAQIGIETAVDGLIASNKLGDAQQKMAESCKDDIREICRATETSDFAQAMKQIIENINIVSEAINDTKEKVTDTLEKGFKEKLKEEAKEKAREAAKEAIEEKIGTTIPTDLKETCSALLDVYSSSKLKAAERRAIELYIKLQILAQATKTRIPNDTSRSVAGRSSGGYARATHDPEGIIYEAVLSNPVEGATATLYERSADGTETVWDATTFGQINPQITTGAGWYQWFVPEGEWQVRVTAPEGSDLQDNTSADNAAANLDDGSTKGWLPVMPVQLGINIPLVSTASPDLKAITVSKDSIEAELSLYVKAEDLTGDAIVVKHGDTILPCKITTLDLDHDPLDETKEYASRVKLEPVSGEAFAEGETYAVTVKAGVTAYNGKQFETDKTLTGEMPVHTHEAGKETVENEVKATCTQKGSYDTVTRCTICGEEMATVHHTQDALGHEWNTPTYTWSADNKTVTAKRICKADASHVETETVAVSIEIVKEPTTTLAGQRRLTAVFKNAGFAKQVKEEVIEKLTKENELKANTLKVKAKKTVTVKYSKLKKKNQKIAAKKVMTVSKNKGKVTYKLKSVTKKKYKKYFKVAAKTGKITVVKKLPKGTYKLKIKVTAAGNDNYKAATKTVTVKIKVN
ncbi:MAG: hypothetical protein K6E75_04420, partial [Lachnospiraceae bacterium]|nr:hypothetical protein [Lachnospiraceae bacterium]